MCDWDDRSIDLDQADGTVLLLGAVTAALFAETCCAVGGDRFLPALRRGEARSNGILKAVNPDWDRDYSKRESAVFGFDCDYDRP